MSIKKYIAFNIFFTACNSSQIVEDAQCSQQEQYMFLACIDAGCSASYEQDLAGKDSCNVDGGGTIISVEAGGECAFTASGSCYVVCDCPDGVSLSADLSQGNQLNIQDNSDSLSDIVMKLVQDVYKIESSIEQIYTKIEEINASNIVLNNEINEIRSEFYAQIGELDSDYSAQIDLLLSENSRLRGEIDRLNSEIVSLNSKNDSNKQDILDLSYRVLSIENSILSIDDEIESLYDSAGLRISRYTVDCNDNNLNSIQYVTVGTWTLRNTKSCIIVNDVDIDDMPIVSVKHVRRSLFSEYSNCYDDYYYTSNPWLYCDTYYRNLFDEFKVGNLDGGYSPGSGQPDDTYMGPGIHIRYDEVERYIYTSSHYNHSVTTTTPYIYHVTVIGNREYSSPQ